MRASSALQLQAAHGRLYASGPLVAKLQQMNGAHYSKPKRRTDPPVSLELSLTLETLRTIRALTKLDSKQLAECMSPPLLAWAKAAGNNEHVVNDMHARLNDGWRASLPWLDHESGFRPWAHQEVMASVAVSIDGCAFLCEMGCVDADTEYLSPTGWRRIADYTGGKVAQYHPVTRRAEFVEPDEFVRLPCAEMIHFTSARGVDQKLSPEHRVLLYNKSGDHKVVRADLLEGSLAFSRNAMRDWRLPTTFIGDGAGVPLTEAQLRLQVAVMADGHFPCDVQSGTRCTVRVKKARKIERMRVLLAMAGVEAYERPVQPEGFVSFSFSAPRKEKSYGEWWWNASAEQLRIVTEECIEWDGTRRKADGAGFFTRDKASADFIQYCFTAIGCCATLQVQGVDYIVGVSATRTLKQLGNPEQNVSREPTTDGHKYCFRVPSTFLVFRRNGKIFPSGNTGKTRAAAEAMAHHIRQGAARYHVAVSTKKSLRMTWAGELCRWTNELRGIVLEGSQAQKRALLGAAKRGELPSGTVLLVNYESLDGLKADFVALMDAQRVGLVLDEMHKIKNPSAHRTKAAMEIARHAAWRLGMTGSPILQGVQDVWSQWYVVDLGVTFGANFVSYKREFMEEVNYFAPYELNGKKELYGEVGLRMRRRGLRYTKAECMDLPPKVYERQQIDMAPEQARAYAEMAETLVAQLREMGAGNWTPEQLADGDSDIDPHEGEKVATASTQLVAMLRLSQITSGFVPDEDGALFHFESNPKLDALEEIVDENIADQQVLVWCRYREDVRAIGERLARYNPVVLWGNKNKAEEDAATAGVLQFQRGERRLLVAIAASGGESLNLQAASLAVYYSQDFSLGARMQSEDRCHRGGSEKHNAVTYIDLMCTDTVDEIVAEALKQKKTISDVVVDLRDHIDFTGADA